MSYRIANRKAELLFQTGPESFRFKLENGVEVDADISAVEFEPDCFLVEAMFGPSPYTGSEGTLTARG